MKKKIYYQNLENFCGLEYLVLQNAPLYKHSEYGEVIDLPPHEMEILAAKTVIQSKVPIRGKEVKLLRSSLDLSLEKFAREFGVASSTVLKWERALNERLSLPNEIVVRLFCAEKLSCPLSTHYSELIDIVTPKTPIFIRAA